MTLESSASILNAWWVLLVIACLSRSRAVHLACYLAVTAVITVEAPAVLAILALECAVVWGAIRLARAHPGRARAVLLGALGAVVVAWATMKYGRLLPPLESAVARAGLTLPAIGFSFVVVKLAQTLLDALARPSSRAPDYPTVLAMSVFPPTYAAGPMHTLGEFEGSFAQITPWKQRDGMEALRRIVWGLAKTRLVGHYAGTVFALPLLADPAHASPPALWAAAFAYGAFIYANFSGMSDIAIGLGAAMGVKVPENFDRPYLAADIQAFWRAWHITFTRFLQSCIFLPLSRRLMKTRLRARPKVAATVGYVVTFTLCGLWHGDEWNFVVWGLWHGAGIALYTVLPPGWRAPRMGEHAPVRAWVWRGATWVFVSLGWVWFACPLPVALTAFRRLLFLG